jgi:hypothetical protein
MSEVCASRITELLRLSAARITKGLFKGKVDRMSDVCAARIFQEYYEGKDDRVT